MVIEGRGLWAGLKKKELLPLGTRLICLGSDSFLYQVGDVFGVVSYDMHGNAILLDSLPDSVKRLKALSGTGATWKVLECLKLEDYL